MLILVFILSQWIKEPGIRIGPGSVPYVISVGDTAFRLYYCNQNGIVSAFSIDGLNFIPDSGVRIPPGDSMERTVADPTLVKIENGYRMYYKGATGPGGPGQARHRIFSAFSTDGLNWVKEGLRYENLGYPDYGWTSVPDAIKLPDGRIRVYYTSATGGIRSIISFNGLDFTPEEGVRLTDCVDPNVLYLPDSSYRMFFATRVGQPQHIGYAESQDGLTYVIIDTIIDPIGPYDSLGCVDPSGIILSDGRFRVYYGGLGSAGVVTLSAISISGISEEMSRNSPMLLKISPTIFSVQTAIHYSLPAKGRVDLRIYSIYGQLVKTLVSGIKESGYHRMTWDGKDDNGQLLSSGVYFVKLNMGEFSQTRKLLLLRLHPF
uniref:T9SS type A sorting domain-containing protein n=1 Tax=candidate division WOR-3 bacterium TaxID=2052148 RepID=A0A7C6AHI9_UNCW3